MTETAKEKRARLELRRRETGPAIMSQLVKKHRTAKGKIDVRSLLKSIGAHARVSPAYVAPVVQRFHYVNTGRGLPVKMPVQ